MPRWRTRTATVLVVPLLAALAACGSQDAPAKLEPTSPAVPEDLCSLLPDTLVGTLEKSSSADQTGVPTAACSLSSAPAATPVVRAVVTITQYDVASAASGVFDSQCRSLDASTATVSQTMSVPGAEKACGSQDKGADSSTLSALQGNNVLTARAASTPAGNPSALARATQMIEAVLSGSSAAPASPTS